MKYTKYYSNIPTGPYCWLWTFKFSSVDVFNQLDRIPVGKHHHVRDLLSHDAPQDITEIQPLYKRCPIFESTL